VDFNNADNGFTATNTQAAIEEVADNLSDLDTSLASVAKSGSYNDLSDTPTLATVATSGSYADLSNTPTLGTAAAKNSTNTISSGSTDLIESGPVYSLKQTLTNQVKDMNNMYGSKNLLPTPYAGTKGGTFTISGLTFVEKQDGSIVCSGTNTSSSTVGVNIAYHNDCSLLAGKTITVSIENAPLFENAYCPIIFRDSSGTALNRYNISSEHPSYTFDVPSTAIIYDFEIYVIAGKSLNTTIYPMIRLASITDDTYEPYAMTNQELTVEKADKSDLASISITGNTNNTGSKITKGTYFYKAGVLVKAILDIADGATLTQNTNYENVTAGGLNDSKIRIGEGKLPSVKETWDVVFTLPTGYTKDNTYLFLCNVYYAGVAMWIGRGDVVLRINASNQVEASSTNPNNENVPCRIGFAHVI
jgi:hypothetical protein